ncbi:MAG: hypothetical protein ACR2FY_00895 [Pirellulaceae bacterium]
MSNAFDPPRAGAGRLLGAFSLACFVVALLVAAAVAAMVSDIVAHPPDVAHGEGGVLVRGFLVVILAVVVVTVSNLVGFVFGLAGLVLALTHPRGKPLWPALGLALNVLPLLGEIFFLALS